MWNFGNLTHQLGDAFEKVRKEVESFGHYDEENGRQAELPKSTAEEIVVLSNEQTEESRGIHEARELAVEEVAQSTGKKTPRPSGEGASLVADENLVHVKFDILKDEAWASPQNGRLAVKVVLQEAETSVHKTDQRAEVANVVHERGEPFEALQTELAVRERQLQEQSVKLLELQERNEALERTALSISKEDHEAVRHQYESRLRAAENKIYELTKERDALAQDSAQDAQKDVIIQEKDEIIAEVMAEGQRLSKKQMDLEAAIRKKAARLREMEDENGGLKEKLMTEMSKCEHLTLEKQQLSQTLQDTESLQKQQLEIQRLQFEKLLDATSAAQAEADQAAKEAAREGLLQRVQEAENRNEILTSHVAALNAEMETQKQQTESAEGRWKEDMRLLEERCHEMEIRHEELMAKFPEATKPLLHQLETLQADMDNKSEAWIMAERTLLEELETAEAAIVAAEGKEQMRQQRLNELSGKCSELEGRVRAQGRALGEAEQSRGELLGEVEKLRKETAALQSELQKQLNEGEKLKSGQQQVLEQLQQEISAERTAKVAKDMELRQLQIEHQKQIADFEELTKRQAAAPQMTVADEISVVSEATDTDAVSVRSVSLSRQHQLERLQKHVQSLEKTREHLSAELVAVTHRALNAEASLQDLQRTKQDFAALQSRYASAIELLGEREEHVEELKSDLEDFKQMYREQIAYVAEQLCAAKP